MQFKNSGHPQFIEKPLKGSKSISKGDQFELEASRYVHGTGAILLVSPLLLRSISCGQIDLAQVYKGKLIVYEVKSSKRSLLSQSQKARLYSSLDFLTQVLGVEGELKVINKLPK